MKFLVDFIQLIPKELQIGIACLVIGGFAFAGMESRYMTVSDFTKSYVLDLKKLIRELKEDLKDPTLTARERHHLEMEIEELMDELCYEKPNDLWCKEYGDGHSG